METQFTPEEKRKIRQEIRKKYKKVANNPGFKSSPKTEGVLIRAGKSSFISVSVST
jgi:hypothetical protein